VTALKYHNSLSKSLAIRFENERLANELAISNQRLIAIADTDELTGLANRRAMFKCLTSEWNRHYRARIPFSLMYIDLDFFKQYNDSYGHEGGDQCLIKIAELLRNHALRSSDLAARFGGEEFALILPNTGNVEAAQIATSILQNLKAMQIPHVASKIATYVTVSIGVATVVPDQPDNYGMLREAADQALYRAKRTGRNRIVSAPSGQQAASSPSTIA
jgi:diguanylate cyclase (GGDEF)-like protein